VRAQRDSLRPANCSARAQRSWSWTHHHPGCAQPIELGAEFIHGRPSATCQALEVFGLDAAETSGRRLLSEAGSLQPLDDFNEIIASVDEQIDPQVDVPYEQFLRSAKASAWQKRIAKSYVEGFNAARSEVIGSASVALADRAAVEIEGDRQYRLPSGYHALMERFAGALPPGGIRMEHIVRVVKWKRHDVEVRCAHLGMEEQFRARSLIVSVPLALLRAGPDDEGGILFDRSLEAKASAMDRLKVGHVVKAVLRFRERFWEDPRLVGDCPEFGFSLCLHAAFSTWWTAQPSTANLLTGWAAGPAAEKLLGKAPEKLRALAITSLAETFHVPEGQIAAQFVDMHCHDWSADPFARGAYSYPGVGGIQAARALAEPLAETLFFAGEATDFQGYSGTVHGAIESGYRATREILAVN
jgi:monoamine oxidase